MGAIANSMVAYAQPLIDATDGSPQQVEKALQVSMLCWNLSLMPEDSQGEFLEKMRAEMKMEEGEFQKFKADVLAPMVRRHRGMFPNFPRWGAENHPRRSTPDRLTEANEDGCPPPSTLRQNTSRISRNSPCPCHSGRKYKNCCGR